jgi:hypothetical protein
MKKIIECPEKFFFMCVLTAMFLMCFLGCNSQTEPTLKYITPTLTIPQELGQRLFNSDSALNVRDIENKALRDSLFIERFKITKIKYYIKICKKNPKNNVFFKGWIIRAIK